MKHQKQPENVEYFSYLGSKTTNDARCARDYYNRDCYMTTVAFSKKKVLFASKLD
jgi:hypothetical protein